MPQTITNPEILALIVSNVAELKSINDINEQINKRVDALTKENQKFVDFMNAEYGWGNWQDVNTTDNTFLSREEFMDKWYVIHNPALRPIVKLDDEIVKESNPQLETGE